ncbi:MAG: DUF6308 family protein [Actinobacteria bacterium]|nr:DUF6308 family protein [Actinomycetota bacterium]
MRWHLVPADARLADADPEGDLYWRAAELYGHFTTLHGVGDAIASKLLHLKRPAVFPILDALIREAYDLGPGGLRARRTVSAPATACRSALLGGHPSRPRASKQCTRPSPICERRFC